jgi:hypothetical protein
MARVRISNVLKRLWANVTQRPNILRVEVIPSMRELPLALGRRLYLAVGVNSALPFTRFSKPSSLTSPCGKQFFRGIR